MARSTCSGCDQTFGGLAGFDRHLKPIVNGRHGGCRRGDDCGLRLRPDGVWVGTKPQIGETANPLSEE